MPDSKKMLQSTDWIWLLLMSLTLVSFGTVNLDASKYRIENAGGLLVLGIALIKVRLIARNFMEVSTTPMSMRVVLDVWLLAVFSGFFCFLA